MTERSICYRVHFSNMGYWKDEDFYSLDAAVHAAKRACFECLIWEQDRNAHTLVAAWSPIGGLRLVP